MPLDTTFPIKLTGLTLREEIEDVIIRACLAFDHGSKELMLSTLTKAGDSQMIIGERTYVGMEIPEALNHVGQMDTQHLISGVRIDVEEDAETAYLTCNFQNQHFPAGEGMKDVKKNLLSAGIYEVDLVKEDDGWKIKLWSLKIIYLEGDFSIMIPAQV